jgi:HEAT repeat protein
LEELLRQHQERQRSLPQREYAIFTFGRLADAATDLLLISLESKDCCDKERIHRVLAAWGAKAAYSIIERICHAKGLYERKSLATALAALGPPAMAPLIAALKDKRWYVVRNMVSIIGELRNPDSVAELKRPLHHPDERVRKETIRALAKIGGNSAEAALIPLLEEPDEGLVRRAISSLGQLRSRQAVPVMLKLLERRDLLLKELLLKKELLAALAAIGDPSATARLLKMLESRGWPVLGRYLELKVALASTLGVLEDETARPTLTRMAAGKGSLAEACRDALAALENGSKN